MAWNSAINPSLAGAVQKAFLIVHEVDASEIHSAAVSAGTMEALTNASAGSSLSAVTANLTGAAAGVKSHVIQVQYNPSSLTFVANAKSIPFTYLMQNIDEGIPNQNPRPPMVVLTVELIFDAMLPQDAFLMDKTRLSMLDAGAGIVKNMTGGYTVQPQTDGLVAAVLRPGTRLVTFRWADMAFTGHIIEVQADYTMFSVSGKPVRSKVRMNIAQQVESSADMQYWDKALDKAFEAGGSLSLKDVSSAAGSLLNLDAFG